LNTNYQYGVGNESAPTVLNASSGLVIQPGELITFQYISGLVSLHPGYGFFDANGNPSILANNNSFSGYYCPSLFFNPADYPTYGGELVGTFADSGGNIVATPFAIGDSRSVIVPNNATQVQLGINDVSFDDNAGSFTIQVTAASAVPEPSSLAIACICIGVACLSFARNSNRRSDRQT
jgi:hypothetical protein